MCSTNQNANGTKKNEITSDVSSETLFHYMLKLSFLKMALKEGLWPRYNLEGHWDGKTFAIPMLSFCDIPLSAVKKHVQKYGSYGIGVTKAFARDIKITPVTYLANKSTFFDKLCYNLRKYETPTTNPNDVKIDEFLYYYIKKVSGKEINKVTGKEENYKFYNEREWRYIPKISNDVHLEIVDNNFTKDNLDKLNEKTIREKIHLSAKDISYIIVSKDSEIKDMVKFINTIPSFSKDKERLYSRIITVEQIQKDF